MALRYVPLVTVRKFMFFSQIIQMSFSFCSSFVTVYIVQFYPWFSTDIFKTALVATLSLLQPADALSATYL